MSSASSSVPKIAEADGGHGPGERNGISTRCGEEELQKTEVNLSRIKFIRKGLLLFWIFSERKLRVQGIRMTAFQLPEGVATSDLQS